MSTLLYNGVIRTMAGTTVSALVVKNGRIVYAGSDSGALAFGAESTLDLEGRCVLPGFVDSHTHILLTEEQYHRLDLRGVRSADEIVRRGRAFLAENTLPDGGWLVGYGFDIPCPGRETADAISTEIPVILDRVCGHIGAGNGPALSLAGFSDHPDGILRETELDRLKRCSPGIDPARTVERLETVGARMAAAGITGVHSDDLGPEGVRWSVLLDACRTLEKRNACSVRLWQEWEAPDPESLRQGPLSQPLRSFQGSDWLKVGNIKLIGDGSLGAKTAFVRDDYIGEPGNRGISVYTQEEMDELVALCHGENLQVACHAIGDGAVERFVNAVEKAMKADPKPLRHRVVHCQFGDKDLYRRMGALGMGADIQPAFVPTDASLAVEYMGKERADSSYAWKTLLRSGVVCGGGSDSPVEDFSPIYGIHCAVNRPDGRGGVFLPEQRLTVEEAVRLYTTGPAVLAHDTENTGTLEAGKMADLVVLSADPFTCPPELLNTIYPVLTMVGGRITYQR